MKENLEAKKFLKWNLLTTGDLLKRKFASSGHFSNVFIIRAAKIDDQYGLALYLKFNSKFLISKFKFSAFSFSNFLQCDAYGSPLPSQANSPNALNELEKVLNVSIEKFNQSSEVKIDKEIPLIVSGFSKGCVVVNRIGTELARYGTALPIKHLIWLDGGHCGVDNFWITDKDVVEALVDKLRVKLYVYVTPYQVHFDVNKANDYKKFVKIISETKNGDKNAKISIYFDERSSKRDINKHFELLNEFSCELIE